MARTRTHGNLSQHDFKMAEEIPIKTSDAVFIIISDSDNESDVQHASTDRRINEISLFDEVRICD